MKTVILYLSQLSSFEALYATRHYGDDDGFLLVVSSEIYFTFIVEMSLSKMYISRSFPFILFLFYAVIMESNGSAGENKIDCFTQKN